MRRLLNVALHARLELGSTRWHGPNFCTSGIGWQRVTGLTWHVAVSFGAVVLFTSVLTSITGLILTIAFRSIVLTLSLGVLLLGVLFRLILRVILRLLL